jgi:protein-S-isoprenylcysteine O-methyltransferase Ste14
VKSSGRTPFTCSRERLVDVSLPRWHERLFTGPGGRHNGIGDVLVPLLADEGTRVPTRLILAFICRVSERHMSRKLQFQSEKSPSWGPKVAITSWYLFCAAAAAWLAFAAPMALNRPGSPDRQAALLVCVLLYLARAAHTLFVFVKRTIPWWEAAWGGGIIGCVLFFFLLGGLRDPQPIGPVDLAGILLYIAGSYIGTASEHARHIWKARPGNRGHLYTEGLFRYSRHINYFGDLLLFGGCAVLTRQPWTGIVPLAMGLNFALVIIPAHDAYLAARYGSEFDHYARRTSKLVPFLY